MKAIKIFLSLLSALFLFCACEAHAAEQTINRIDINSIRGPKLEELSMLIITNPDAQILAAEAGEVDILSDVARPSDIERLASDPKLEMSLARGMHAFFLLLNNKNFPWDDAAVRRAAAMSIDRSAIVRMIFSGYCEPINSWLPPVSPWAIADSSRDIYDPEAAEKLLLESGYSRDAAGFLRAPDGRPFPKIAILTPLARLAPTTAELAELIADSLRAAGFPAETEPIDFSTMIARLDRKEYSAAVLAWGMGRNPDSLYSFYHSSMDFPGGYNMTGVNDARLDAALERLRFAPDEASAHAASTLAQQLLSELVPSIPIYSRFSVAAISRGWKNIFTTDRITADNMWTLLSAEPADGRKRPLRMVLAEEPRNLNPFTASSAYSWQVLGMIYESMLGTDPYTLENMPAIAESWSVRTEGDGAARHTELLFKIKRGLKWSDGSPLSSHDIKATIDFMRENKLPRFFDNVKNVREVESVDDYTLRVVMDGVSYWYLDNIGGLPCFPKKVLDAVADWQNWDPVSGDGSAGPRGLLGSGPFTLESYRAGEYVMMRRNAHYRLLEDSM